MGLDRLPLFPTPYHQRVSLNLDLAAYHKIFTALPISAALSASVSDQANTDVAMSLRTWQPVRCSLFCPGVGQVGQRSSLVRRTM